MMMYRSEDERLTYIVMGDAVLQLLQIPGPVTSNALLEKLRLMALQERAPERLMALRRAMADVMNNMEENGESQQQATNNVTYILRRRATDRKDIDR